ncbi:tetratricopeptide repeat protein [Rhizobium rosettiformans]|uniref:tetratricopeptide repeat protein n=1 Tax=Rhizobium rosettiformans TaxID=1368430 RepID=UPI00285C339D|nr:tetratricopeptide repeat protein [Rhizobium rosettiformans]MDR7029134.1 tetratricopeptide (TPR) repeat protein [Rhizobium rosettiformans]MDR7062848.1 tetratricopeptide (TPR) repeat protein [Rhizobium rosettiformans]
MTSSYVVRAFVSFLVLGTLVADLSLAQPTEVEIVHIDPSQIQTLVVPPWERPTNDETRAWEDSVRASVTDEFGGDFRKAAGAAANKGFQALDALDFASASKAFSEAAVLDPKSPYPYLGFVDIYRLMNKLEKKEFCLQAAIDRSERQRAALIMIGTHLGIDGDYGKAVEFFNSVLELDAKDQGAHLMLAKTYRLLKDPERAEYHEQRAKE